MGKNTRNLHVDTYTTNTDILLREDSSSLSPAASTTSSAPSTAKKPSGFKPIIKKSALRGASAVPAPQTRSSIKEPAVMSTRRSKAKSIPKRARSPTPLEDHIPAHLRAVKASEPGSEYLETRHESHDAPDSENLGAGEDDETRESPRNDGIDEDPNDGNTSNIFFEDFDQRRAIMENNPKLDQEFIRARPKGSGEGRASTGARAVRRLSNKNTKPMQRRIKGGKGKGVGQTQKNRVKNTAAKRMVSEDESSEQTNDNIDDVEDSREVEHNIALEEGEVMADDEDEGDGVRDSDSDYDGGRRAGKRAANRTRSGPDSPDDSDDSSSESSVAGSENTGERPNRSKSPERQPPIPKDDNNGDHQSDHPSNGVHEATNQEGIDSDSSATPTVHEHPIVTYDGVETLDQDIDTLKNALRNVPNHVAGLKAIIYKNNLRNVGLARKLDAKKIKIKALQAKGAMDANQVAMDNVHVLRDNKYLKKRVNDLESEKRALQAKRAKHKKKWRKYTEISDDIMGGMFWYKRKYYEATGMVKPGSPLPSDNEEDTVSAEGSQKRGRAGLERDDDDDEPESSAPPPSKRSKGKGKA